MNNCPPSYTITRTLTPRVCMGLIRVIYYNDVAETDRAVTLAQISVAEPDTDALQELSWFSRP